MTIPVIICDDSGLARKQMARALPPEWDISLGFAENGEQALEAIRNGLGHVLFLDLNMPGMSGFEVLDTIRRQDLPTSVLVVSGDIQAQAQAQVMKKGALDFISKPIDTEHLREVLRRTGLLDAAEADHDAADPSITGLRHETDEVSPSFVDAFREVINVAMGQAGGRLGEALDTFIGMPIPVIHQCRYDALAERLQCAEQQQLYGVSQGFGSLGVAGEALLLISEQDLLKAGLMENYPDSHDEVAHGVLIDLCSLLAGSCLVGISEQLDFHFNHTAPVILGQGKTLKELLGTDSKSGSEQSGPKQSSSGNAAILAVEISYSLKNDAACHLVLLFTDDSLRLLRQRTALLNA